MWKGCFPFVTFAIAISSVSNSSRCLRGHCVGASAGDVVGSSCTCTCAVAHHFMHEHMPLHDDTSMHCRHMAGSVQVNSKGLEVYLLCTLGHVRQRLPCIAQERQLIPYAKMESRQRSWAMAAHLHEDAINPYSHSCAGDCGYEIPEPTTGHSTALHFK